jgi:hypothetical protein
MSAPGGPDIRMRRALLIALVVVVVVAPVIGAFAFSPILVAMDIQPYPLAAALGVMLAEAIAVAALGWLVFREKK